MYIPEVYRLPFKNTFNYLVAFDVSLCSSVLLVASQNGPNPKRPQSKMAPLSVIVAPNNSKNRLKWPCRRISSLSLPCPQTKFVHQACLYVDVLRLLEQDVQEAIERWCYPSSPIQLAVPSCKQTMVCIYMIYRMLIYYLKFKYIIL